MENQGPSLLKAPSVIEIRNIPEFHSHLIEAMNSSPSLVLDLDDVTDIDLTFVQLVESARLSAIQSGKSLRLSAPASGAVLAALERGGFLVEPTDTRTQFWLAA